MTSNQDAGVYDIFIELIDEELETTSEVKIQFALLPNDNEVAVASIRDASVKIQDEDQDDGDLEQAIDTTDNLSDQVTSTLDKVLKGLIAIFAA